MNTYLIIIKSHCEAPDYEKEFEAKNIKEATDRVYRDLKGEFDYKDCKPARIYKNGKIQ